jgi:predicted MFS family arabinose efflux permease
MKFGHEFHKMDELEWTAATAVYKRVATHRDDIALKGQQEEEDDTLELETTANNNNSEEETPSSSLLSIHTAVERIGYGPFQVRILVSTGMCFAADAMQIVSLSFLTPVLKREWNLGSTQAASVMSVLFAGAMTGTLCLGPFADRIGRRPVFFVAALTIAMAGFGVSLASNLIQLLLAMFFVGFGVGGLTVPFDIMAEFLPSDKRGVNLLIIDYFWTAGCLYVVACAFWVLHTSWRLFVVACTIPCLLALLTGIFWVPESPRWLASQNRLEEAIQVLRAAAAMNHTLQAIPADISLLPEPKERNATIADLFLPHRRRMILFLFGAWSSFAFGYYGTIMATTRVFESSHSSNNDDSDETHFDYNAIFISNAAEIVGVSLVILIVDRLGRILSQVVSYLMTGVLLGLLCTLAEFGAHRSILVALGFAVRMFAMSATCVTWVSTAEMLTTDIRSTGHSTANALAKIGAFFCPYLVESDTKLWKIGLSMFFVHSFTAFCVSQLPETKGRELGATGAREGMASLIQQEDEGSEAQAELPCENGELS